MLPIAFSPTDPRCHGNEIWDKTGYNLVCVKIICKIFAFIKGISEMRYRMLPNEFYLDRLSLPGQQNLRHNGLYLGPHNKYYQDPCIWRWGAGWGFNN